MTPLVPLSVRVSYQLWGRLENAAAQAGYMSDTPEYAEDVRVVFYISPEELDRAVGTGFPTSAPENCGPKRERRGSFPCRRAKARACNAEIDCPEKEDTRP